jgi:hypothetical protein
MVHDFRRPRCEPTSVGVIASEVGPMRRLRRALVLGAALLSAAFLGRGEALAETRVALVIGNTAYEHAPGLPNTQNDAADIAAALARLGFDVTRRDDQGFEGFRRTLLSFSRAASTADVAVVFYAGHGFEVDNQNYLVPVDARLARWKGRAGCGW